MATTLNKTDERGLIFSKDVAKPWLLVSTESRVGLASNDNKPEITARNKTTHARVYDVDYLFCERIVGTRATVEKEKRYDFIPVKPVVANLNGQKTNVIKWV